MCDLASGPAGDRFSGGDPVVVIRWQILRRVPDSVIRAEVRQSFPCPSQDRFRGDIHRQRDILHAFAFEDQRGT